MVKTRLILHLYNQPQFRGTPPFYKLVLHPKHIAEYEAIGVPEAHRPLGSASLEWCPWSHVGDLVVDQLGQWCIVLGN